MPPDPSLHTAQLQAWAERIRAGDCAAPDELFRDTGARLEALARRMLNRFPEVRRFEQTGDVLNNALLRLLRALREVQPTSVRDFFGLAAEQIRRELIDLARHYSGPQGLGANQVVNDADSGLLGQGEAIDDGEDSADLDCWEAFHEAVAGLPAVEREVVGLIFYHGWQHNEVAQLLQVTERSVRRHWQRACLRLNEVVGGWFPQP
jgi:RNA polymerase sigma-70 factor (ECF subfamily)